MQESIYNILVINPGSTSTKIAIYKNLEPYKTINIDHSRSPSERLSLKEDLKFRANIIEQYLIKNKIIIKDIDIIIARGGLLRPLKSGVYEVNDKMIADLESERFGKHASNYGAQIAKLLSEKYQQKCYIADPVVVDEMNEVAKITGIKGIKRKSQFHALNHKSVANEVAKQLKKPYSQCNFVVAHMGGGISIGTHYQGQVIDVANALLGDAPFSGQRAGALPLSDLIDLCYNNLNSKSSLENYLVKECGFYSYFKTYDMKYLEDKLDENKEIKLIYDAMIYQIAKQIGSYAVPLKGQIDSIILTGGLANSTYVIDQLKSYISWIADVIVIPGENELFALAKKAYNVLTQKEDVLNY